MMPETFSSQRWTRWANLTLVVFPWELVVGSKTDITPTPVCHCFLKSDQVDGREIHETFKSTHSVNQALQLSRSIKTFTTEL